MDPLFAALPEDLSALTDEALSEALAERLATIDKIEADDQDTVGERSAAQVIEEMTSGVEQIEAIRAEQKSRADAEAEYQSQAAALAARAHEGDPEPEVEEPVAETETLEARQPDEDEDEGDADAEEDGEGSDEVPDSASAETEEVAVEQVAASGPRQMRRPPRATARSKPVPSSERAQTPLLASAGIRGFRAGQELDRDDLAKALLEAHRVTTARSPGVEERVVVASARFEYPEDRRLGDNPYLNTQRIDAVTSPEAITAAGGLCAPLTPFYDLNICGASANRPVRDALTGFQATRGGISYPSPLSLEQVSDGIGIVTAAEDEAGGSAATKNCVVVDCDPYTDAEIYAVYACIQHGNFGARTWPERVSALSDLLAAQHARVAEIQLLDQLSAGSTAVTDEAKYGAYSTLLQGIVKAAAGMRSRYRQAQNARLRALFPAWAVDLLIADMAHSPFDRFERSREGLTAALENIAGVTISWYLDGPTGKNQIFGPQAAGALLEFPTTAVWYLWTEGSWLFLDGGELDLGIVRDSVLNATNDFQVFMETFEAAANVGCQSLEITSTVCANGDYSMGSDPISC